MTPGVASGCELFFADEIAGIDYEETFVPVIRYDSLCLIIALAVNRGLLLE